MYYPNNQQWIAIAVAVVLVLSYMANIPVVSELPVAIRFLGIFASAAYLYSTMEKVVPLESSYPERV